MLQSDGLHSYSQLVRDLTTRRDDLSEHPTHHKEESKARITRKRINLGATTTVDTEVIFNRTLGIIGSGEFDLHDFFTR